MFYFSYTFKTLIGRCLFGFFILILAIFSIKQSFIFSITETLTDPRLDFSVEILLSGLEWNPDSARLLYRLAQKYQENSNDHKEIEAILIRSAELSPNNYNIFLSLALNNEEAGENEKANLLYQKAIELSPNFSDSHWMFANFLSRQNLIDKALIETQRAIDLNPGLAPNAYSIAWEFGKQNPQILEKLAADDENLNFILADFFSENRQTEEASEILKKLSEGFLLNKKETAKILKKLWESDKPETALILWNKLFPEAKSDTGNLIWNGNFDNNVHPFLNQFDWNLVKNKYVEPSIIKREKISNTSILLFYFLGKDTTRLENEVNQKILLNCSKTYQLSFNFNSLDFKGEEMPQVIVRQSADNVFLKLDLSSTDGKWKQLDGKFSTLQCQKSASFIKSEITIIRRPRFSYDAPMSGALGFDDFVLTEVK